MGRQQFDRHIARQFLGNAISSSRNSRGARPPRRDLPLNLSRQNKFAPDVWRGLPLRRPLIFLELCFSGLPRG